MSALSAWKRPSIQQSTTWSSIQGQPTQEGQDQRQVLYVQKVPLCKAWLNLLGRLPLQGAKLALDGNGSIAQLIKQLLSSKIKFEKKNLKKKKLLHGNS